MRQCVRVLVIKDRAGRGESATDQLRLQWRRRYDGATTAEGGIQADDTGAVGTVFEAPAAGDVGLRHHRARTCREE